MAIATALISSLFNVTSSQDVLFLQPQQLQCLHYGSTEAYLCTPFELNSFFHCCIDDDLWYTHYGFGVSAELEKGASYIIFCLGCCLTFLKS